VPSAYADDCLLFLLPRFSTPDDIFIYASHAAADYQLIFISRHYAFQPIHTIAIYISSRRHQLSCRLRLISSFSFSCRRRITPAASFQLSPG